MRQSDLHLQPTTEEYEDYYLNKTELKDNIENLRNKKAPGEDGIQGILIKNLPDNIIEVLIDINNSSIHHNYFPLIWKNAQILNIRVHKHGRTK